jgi:hypothetical protein
MIKEHYQALKQRLFEIPDVKIIDWYMGQDESLEGNNLVWGTPAIYIEFDPIQWQTLGNGIQRGTMTFNIRLVTDSLHDSDQKLFDTFAIDHFAFTQSLFTQMMNWRCNASYLPQFGQLLGTNEDVVLMESVVRLNTTPIHEVSDLLRTVQTFTCVVYDYSAVKQWQTIVANIQYDVIKVNQL